MKIFQVRLDPIGLPQGQFAAPCADGNLGCHQWPQPAQLEALQPPQDDVAAVDFTVSPPEPLLKKPQVDIRRQTFLLWHSEHSGSGSPKTRYSKVLPQSWHWYS
jgi:hypothetical protein